MKKILPVLLCFMLLFASLQSTAQIEVAHLRSKGYSATGFGAFLNFAFPVTETGFVTLEAAAYIFSPNDEGTVLVPFVVGYRKMLQADMDPGRGLYVEPIAGYNIGASDVPELDDNGNPLYNTAGEPITREVKGPSAGLGLGYIIPGGLGFNIGLRYQHIFVSKSASPNLYSLRVSFPLRIGGKRE